MNIGYIRVSTKEQNEGRQLETMHKLGIDDRFIFMDKSTGKDFDREQYQTMKLMLREGDCLYVDSLDRLGRNYDKIKEEWFYITKKVGCDIICLDMQDVFNSKKFREMGDIGKVMEDMMLSMLSYVAEQELKKNRERQKQGIELAKSQGKYIGRKRIECGEKFFEVTNKWLKDEITFKQAYTELEMSKSTFLNKCRENNIRKQA